jgi:UDPglucose 6-dehydrogenase
VVALLGLTYKPGTDSLRRSPAIELAHWLLKQGAIVHAHDPAVRELPPELRDSVRLFDQPRAALERADLAVIATEWPAFAALERADFVETMRTPYVVDQNWFLAKALDGPDVTYVAVGRPPARNQ